jgi:hypothetical protein
VMYGLPKARGLYMGSVYAPSGGGHS